MTSEKELKGMIAIYRELLELSRSLMGTLQSGGDISDAGEIVKKRDEVIEKLRVAEAAAGGLKEVMKREEYANEIVKLLEEIAVTDGKCAELIEEGRSEIQESLKNVKSVVNAAKGYSRKGEHGGQGRFISIKE